jgi:hypothetical protein
MKRHAFATAAFLGLLLMSSLAPAYAQSLKFEVPFDFVAAQGTMMPAGEYRVTPNQPTQGLVRLVSSTGASAAICLTHSIQSSRPSDTAKLVFNRYGTQYFLSQVWSQGNNLGHALPPSKAEREIAKTFSKSGKEILTASVKK